MKELEFHSIQSRLTISQKLSRVQAYIKSRVNATLVFLLRVCEKRAPQLLGGFVK